MNGKKMIQDAREGMKVVLEAAVLNKVKRIVVTSSYSTILGAGWKNQGNKEKQIYTDYDFAPYDETPDPYMRSKIA